MISYTEILLIDDDPLALKVLQEHLTQAGYHITMAETGEKALQLLHQTPKRFSLIILDRMMPGLSGIDLLHKLLTDSELQKIPVIMLTSHAEREDIGAAIIAGVYDFLFKPIEKTLLLMVVKRALTDKSFTT